MTFAEHPIQTIALGALALLLLIAATALLLVR